MNRRTSLLAACLFLPVAVTGGCTQGEINVDQAGGNTPPKGVVSTVSVKGQVDTAIDRRPTEELAPGGNADSLPTPDRSQWRPRMPMIRVGSCPGEDCTYGNLVVACEHLSLVASDSLGAKQTGTTIHKGDTVTLVTGNLHLIEPGIVLIKRDYEITKYPNPEGGPQRPRRDTLRFVAGDTLYVLDYVELGEWNWWYRGKAGDGEEFWTGVGERAFSPEDEHAPAIAITKPRGEWWYKLQKDGESEGGWVQGGRGRFVDRKFLSLVTDWKCGSDPQDSDLRPTE